MRQPSQASSPVRRPGVGSLSTKIFYLLSFIAGGLGSYFVVQSEVADEGDVPNRMLSALMLVFAGIFLEAATLSELPSVDKRPCPKLEDVEVEFEDNEAKEINETPEMKLEYLPQAGESRRIPSRENASPADSIEMTDLRSPSSAATVVSESSLSVPAMSSATYLMNLGRKFLPSAWFSQAFYLLIRNAIDESKNAYLFPHTALLGLTAGHLFHASMRAWPCWGLRDWLEQNRNELTLFEYILFLTLPSTDKVNILFYCTTASFWSGYNLNDLTRDITDQLLGGKIQTSDEADIVEDHSLVQPPRRHRTTNFLISGSGAVLASASILLLKLTPEDSAGWRNFFAQLLAAAGCYALTYPLGLYLGAKIPERYHKKTLTAVIYLLIPCAAPDLSIPHYLLLTGGGLCGGIANHIINARYHNQLTLLHQQLSEMTAQVTGSSLFSQLLALSLSADDLLLQHRKKNVVSKKIINVFLFLLLLLEIFLFSSSRVSYKTGMMGIFYPVGILLGLNWLLPKYSPSIYRIQKLSFFARFFYSDSLTFTFIIKVLVFLFLKNYFTIDGKPLNYSSSRTPAVYLAFNLVSIPSVVFVAKAAYKKFSGGYIPCHLSKNDIKKLTHLFDHQTLSAHLNAEESKSQPVQLNYHLLKFMQENIEQIQESKNMTMDSEQALEEKVREEKSCIHPLSKLSLFAMPRTPFFNDESAAELPSVPLARLHCRECQQERPFIHTIFSHADQRYTRQRFDISFEERTVDATVRGFGVTHHFQFTLPSSLSLTDLHRFTF